MQAFLDHPPASFDQLWRSGALPGLVVTLAKGAGGSSASLEMLRALLILLLLAPSCPGQEPWCAASPERQQCALFVLAQAGRHASAIARAAHSGPAGQRLGDNTGALLPAAVAQLGRQPLRQLLEVAAPALVADADALLSSSLGSAPGSSALLGRTVELVSALSAQLDPLALGLRLPGCYNPACTSLAGASEAAMKLQRCSACKIARWGRGSLVCLLRLLAVLQLGRTAWQEQHCSPCC